MLNKQDHMYPRGLLAEDHRTVVEDLVTLEHSQLDAALQAEIVVKDCGAKLMLAKDSVVAMPVVGDTIMPVIDELRRELNVMVTV
jgi:hypothetical protein